MNEGFDTLIERLILIAFFSGYPLIYAVIKFATRRATTSNLWVSLYGLLPYSYAFISTLFLGLLLRDLDPHYDLTKIPAQFHSATLFVWGLLGVLFWIPLLAKRPLYSLLHSLVFFFLLLQDLLILNGSNTLTKENFQNEMRMYTVSLLMNSVALAVIFILHFIIKKKKSAERP